MCVIIVSRALFSSQKQNFSSPKIHQGLGVASHPPSDKPFPSSTSRHPRRRRERQRDDQTNVTKRRTRRTKRPGTISVVTGVVTASTKPSRVARRFVTFIHSTRVRSRPPRRPHGGEKRRRRRRDRARDVPTNASDIKKTKSSLHRVAHPHRARARNQSINQSQRHIPPSPPREPRSPPREPRARSSSPARARARARVVPRT